MRTGKGPFVFGVPSKYRRAATMAFAILALLRASAWADPGVEDERTIQDPRSLPEVSAQLIDESKGEQFQVGKTLEVPDFLSGVQAADGKTLHETKKLSLRILRYIAAGGEGAIYECEVLSPGPHHGQRYALKKINPGMDELDPEMLGKFDKRIERLKDAPGFIKLYGTTALQDGTKVQLWELAGESINKFRKELAMVTFDNTPLNGWVPVQQGKAAPVKISNEPPPDAGSRIDVLSEIAQQSYVRGGEAGQRGIVHGDLKEANIMLNRPGATIKDLSDGQATLKVGDYGTTTPVEEYGTRYPDLEILHGTVGIMPPERFLGDYSRLQGFDLFSIGAMLFKLMYGKYPVSYYLSDSKKSTGMTAELVVLMKPAPQGKLSDYEKMLVSVEKRLFWTELELEKRMVDGTITEKQLKRFKVLKALILGSLQRTPEQRFEYFAKNLANEIHLNKDGVVERVNITREEIVTPPQKPLPEEALKTMRQPTTVSRRKPAAAAEGETSAKETAQAANPGTEKAVPEKGLPELPAVVPTAVAPPVEAKGKIIPVIQGTLNTPGRPEARRITSQQTNARLVVPPIDGNEATNPGLKPVGRKAPPTQPSLKVVAGRGPKTDLRMKSFAGPAIATSQVEVCNPKQGMAKPRMLKAMTNSLLRMFQGR